MGGKSLQHGHEPPFQAPITLIWIGGGKNNRFKQRQDSCYMEKAKKKKLHNPAYNDTSTYHMCLHFWVWLLTGRLLSLWRITLLHFPEPKKRVKSSVRSCLITCQGRSGDKKQKGKWFSKTGKTIKRNAFNFTGISRGLVKGFWYFLDLLIVHFTVAGTE